MTATPRPSRSAVTIVEERPVREAGEGVVERGMLERVHLLPQAIRDPTQDREQRHVQPDQDELEHDHDRDERVARRDRDRGVVPGEDEDAGVAPARDAHGDEGVQELVLPGHRADTADDVAVERLGDERQVRAPPPDQLVVGGIGDPPACVDQLAAHGAVLQHTLLEEQVECRPAGPHDGCQEVPGP
jgi:hypothetical protein